MPEEEQNINETELTENKEDTFADPEQQNGTAEGKQKRSKIFGCLSTLLFWLLLAALGSMLVVSAFLFDFLNIIQLRQKIPQKLRQMWPLAKYYELVEMHRLPEEERYTQMLYQEQERYDSLIKQAEIDFKNRENALEKSYRGMIRTKKEEYNKEMQDLRKQREELILREKKLAEAEKSLTKRKADVDALSKQLASETLNLESSLIKFMEEENRLDQVRSIAEQMDPKALGKIFDEVADDKLIYDILSGLHPVQAGNVLSNIDAEKAGKIIGLGRQQKSLPPPNGPSRNYIPNSLQNLIDKTQSAIR